MDEERSGGGGGRCRGRTPQSPSRLAIVGDVHGHLQMALTVTARWQQQHGAFEAVFLCGDVGSFTIHDQLDSTTRRHGKANPCELEFLQQWAVRPQPPWLAHIFREVDDEGLGLLAPIVMVHGNHEGFKHLATLAPGSPPADPVAMDDLPRVDSAGHIRYLPSGWRVRLQSGYVAGGVGGIERGQRAADYHPMAYVDESAVLALCEAAEGVDLIFTHQGPAETQREVGSETLQYMLDQGVARAWFHGHSIRREPVQRGGPGQRTLVVALGDVASPMRGPRADEPGADGWAVATVTEETITVNREAPAFLREFRRSCWVQSAGLWISPTSRGAIAGGDRRRGMSDAADLESTWSAHTKRWKEMARCTCRRSPWSTPALPRETLS